MRIAMVVDHFDPDVHGSHDYYLSRHLALLGHDVTLITSTHPTRWGAVTAEYMRKEFRPCRMRYENFTLLRTPAGIEFSFIPLMPKLYSELRRGGYDIIHSHENMTFSSLWCALAARKARKPFILTQTCCSISGRFPWSIIHCIADFFIGRFVVKSASAIIALTPLAKDFLVKSGADEKKVVVLPTGVEPEKFKPSNKNLLSERYGIRGNVVLCVSRLIENKGVHVLIEAFSKAKKEVKDAKLVIVGVGPWEQRLKAMAHGIDDVHFLGRVEHDKMPFIYSGADVFVFPTLYEEPFGNVAVEASSSGLPVIGSYIGGIRDTVVHGKTGYHIRPGDAKKLAFYMIKILRDRKLAEKLGKNSRRMVLEKFDWKIIAKRTEEVYRGCAR